MTIQMSKSKYTRKYNNYVYDVGMHKGEDTDYYLKKGFHVIGFEADPDLTAYCKIRFSNEIENGKLILVEGAIAEPKFKEYKIRTIQFYRNKKYSVWGTVVRSWAHRNELLGTSNEIINVPIINFSKCLKKYGIPYYLKIDIEGMDVVCLKALKSFKQKPSYVSIETEKESFDKFVEELNLLTQLGFTRFKNVQQASVVHQMEPYPTKEGYYVSYLFQKGSSGLFGEDLPNKWKDYKQIVNEYKFIFLQYKLFGDYGKLNKYFIGKVLRTVLSILLRKPIPGWYDIHAKNISIVS